MRIRVAQQTIYRYESPAKSVIQTLRATPRSHDGQHVMRWRIDVDQDVKLSETEDAFGNIVHVFTASGRIEELRVVVEGEVETQDRAGLLRGVIERFPPTLFLRDTALTQADEPLRAFAREQASRSDSRLSTCHALMEGVRDAIALDTGADAVATSATEAFAAGTGVAQDLAHAFIAAARATGIPARYVSGHLFTGEAPASRAGHAWAEAHVEGFGWIGFDPSLAVCPMEQHVRVAVGLDYLGAAPSRGARYGGGEETLDVVIDVREKALERQARRQVQS